MSATTLASLIARCRVLCRPRLQEHDAELLRRFVHQRDGTAFEELLERYAPLVWGVCRRMLPGEADCEDAFQATFLALVRKPGSIDPNKPLGGWLHTVTVRIVRKAQLRSSRLRSQAEFSEYVAASDVADEVGNRELFRIVDEEIERLPVLLRQPLLLCCLQGRARDEAAEVLGCSVAAVKSRLERGRDLLRRRLQRRGVQLPAAFLVLGLSTERIRAALWAKTMQSALYTPAPAIATLAESGIAEVAMGKYKLLLTALLLVSSAAGAVGSLLTEKPAPVPTAPQANAVAEKKNETPQIRMDRHNVPLPDGAIARLGTVRWRHGVVVNALAYSPDGKMIVTAGVGRALVLWDAVTGKSLRVFPARGQPKGVTFSPDGKLIATIEQRVQIWEVTTGKLLRELKNPQAGASALAFAPDGTILAIANIDGTVYMWGAASGEEKHRIDCGQGRLRSVAFALDGKLLASGGSDGTIRLWDVVTCKEVRRIATPKKEISSIVFSPDGKLLASGSNDDSPRLWDVPTGQEIRAFGEEKQGAFAPLAISPDGKLLASGYTDGTFRLWEAASGEEKRHWHPSSGSGVARSLAFSPDSNSLATAVLWDGGIRLWDVATGRERHSSEDHHGLITLLRFAADNKTLISAGFDRNLLSWDVATQTPRRLLQWTTDSFGGFALSPDGSTLAACNYKTGEMWLWDVHTGRAAKLEGMSSKKVDQSAQTIAFSPNGRFVASGRFDQGIVQIWDVRERKEVRQLKGSAIPSRLARMRLLFSPDGRVLACGTLGVGNEVRLHLWDVPSGKELHLFANQGAGISPDAFSPDGKVLATAEYPRGSQEPLVRLFDMRTGKELCRHLGHTGFGAVAFSRDGKLVVSGGRDQEDNCIDVWEAATGRLIRRFEGHHSWVSAVTFASDGLTVASSAGDSTILLWDITGRQKDGKLPRTTPTVRQLETCWTALANEDAAKAYDAVWSLVAAPEQAVFFLQKHLTPAPRPDAKVVARLLADLDSNDFAVRQKASEELSKLGDAITPALREALDGKPSLEVRRRLQQVFDQIHEWNAERLRDHRAIQVLEHIGTRQAKEVLQALADGSPQTRKTEEAKAALQRIPSRARSAAE